MNAAEQYFSQISQLKEAEDFMRVLNKWNTLSMRIENGDGKPMVLPDLFWVAKSGVGKTHLLKLLSEYLYASGNLMDFHGNVKYFEFMLDYCPPQGEFKDVQRLINDVRNAAGFRNFYRGIVAVDVEEWLGHCEEKNFITFLEYLSSNSDNWLIIFNVTGEQEEEIKRMESVLSMFFRLEKSELKLPVTAELVKYVANRLSIHNLSLDESAERLIFDVIEKLRKNKHFDGYKTLIILCQDIVYEVFSGENECNGTVSAAELQRFAPDSAYIERVSWNTVNKSRIGLLSGGKR